MASNRINALVREVETLSNAYSSLSTELSNSIEAFEKLLNGMSGKIAVSTATQGRIELIFARKDTGNWRLLCAGSHHPPRLLADAPVEQKIEAVKLFEPLLKKMAEEHRKKRDQLSQALATIKELVPTNTITEGNADVPF